MINLFSFLKKYGERIMKFKRTLLTFTFMLLSALFLYGCSNEPEEIIPTFYNSGIYAPEDQTYELKLPSEKWIITGEENPEDITFNLNKNQISIKRWKNADELYQEKIREIPSVQSDLEEQLKEQNIKKYTINTFTNNIHYDNNTDLSLTQFIYYVEESKSYNVFYYVKNENYLYELYGVTTSENTLEEIKNSFNNFLLTVQDEKVEIFNLKETSFDGNLYTSKNNDFTLTLPYGNWNFVPAEAYSDGPYTVITSDNIEITIIKNSKFDLSNTIIYEIPNTIEILNKQIEIKSLGPYELVDYKVKTIGEHQDYEKNNYTIFSYLIKCENQDKKYYAYTEYRAENITYQITGILTTDDSEKAQEMYQVMKSFSALTDY